MEEQHTRPLHSLDPKWKDLRITLEKEFGGRRVSESWAEARWYELFQLGKTEDHAPLTLMMEQDLLRDYMDQLRKVRSLQRKLDAVLPVMWDEFPDVARAIGVEEVFDLESGTIDLQDWSDRGRSLIAKLTNGMRQMRQENEALRKRVAELEHEVEALGYEIEENASRMDED